LKKKKNENRKPVKKTRRFLLSSLAFSYHHFTCPALGKQPKNKKQQKKTKTRHEYTNLSQEKKRTVV